MNLTMNIRNRRTYKEHAGLFMIKSAAWIVVALFLSSLGYIAYHGAGTLSPSFLSTFPEKMMEEGGILPCIIGTAILSVGAMAVALPLGIACAVWLNEYAKEGPGSKNLLPWLLPILPVFLPLFSDYSAWPSLSPSAVWV